MRYRPCPVHARGQRDDTHRPSTQPPRPLWKGSGERLWGRCPIHPSESISPLGQAPILALARRQSRRLICQCRAMVCRRSYSSVSPIKLVTVGYGHPVQIWPTGQERGANILVVKVYVQYLITWYQLLDRLPRIPFIAGLSSWAQELLLVAESLCLKAPRCTAGASTRCSSEKMGRRSLQAPAA